MIQSRPIDVDGRFVGVAVSDTRRWRFLATDPAVEDIDGADFASLADVTRIARSVLRRTRITPTH